MKKIEVDFKQMVEKLNCSIQYLEGVFKLLKIKWDKGDGELHNSVGYDKECEKLTIQISNIKCNIKQLTLLDISEYEQCDHDNIQYGYYNSDSDTYFFREFNRLRFSYQYEKLKQEKWKVWEVWFNPAMWVEEHIDLKQYSDKEKEDAMLGYYQSFDAMKEIYGEDYKFVLAECIFEQSNGLY